MKKFLSLFLGAILCTFAFVSCEDKSSAEEITPTDNLTITDVQTLDDQGLSFYVTFKNDAIPAFNLSDAQSEMDPSIITSIIGVFKNFEVYVGKEEGTTSKNAWKNCIPYIMNSNVTVNDFTKLMKEYLAAAVEAQKGNTAALDKISDDDKTKIDQMLGWFSKSSMEKGALTFPVEVHGLAAATKYYLRMHIEMSDGKSYYSKEVEGTTAEKKAN